MTTDAVGQRGRSSPPEDFLVSPPTPVLPKGGGAVRGIGEKFAVNPVTGTASFTVPFSISPGRSGVTPALSLAYDSGAGNSAFGVGWSLSIPAVSRKTDGALPRYHDAHDSDTFVLSGGEDLVPSLKDDGTPHTIQTADYTVRRYRPRIEGAFARIEKWTRRADGDTHWRVMTADNVVSVYGLTDALSSRIADPDDDSRVFCWLLDETRDALGNIIRYVYKPEDLANVDRLHPAEANRRFTNRYLKRVLYGNHVPGLADTWHFEVVLDYGEHDVAVPTVDEIRPWARRADPFSTYRAGFEVRTYRLCRRVLMFHRFDELGAAPCLVRSTDFEYAENPVLTKLVAVTQPGYIRHENGDYSRKSIPPLEFTYTEPAADPDVRTLSPADAENLPAGLDGVRYQWIDLDAEGLNGLLAEHAGTWFYKRNLGGGRFEAMQPLSRMPSAGALSGGGQHLMDLAGDGTLDLVQFSDDLPGFFERADPGGWHSFQAFHTIPAGWRPGSEGVFVDLDGDGRADLLIGEDDVFRWHPLLGERGFAPAEVVGRPRNEQKGPTWIATDAAQGLLLADLSGDGLTDIVRIRNGEVCYWPNLGYGRFGAKIVMADAPIFDRPDAFDPRRVRLVDIDGSGPSDLLYVGIDGVVRAWSNLSGNGWSPASTIHRLPPIDGQASVAALDLLGTGTACLVWSSPRHDPPGPTLQYLDLMGSRKPHLLAGFNGNLGSRTLLRYASSALLAAEDRALGRPWATRLSFPVHVVERTETIDEISGSHYASEYRYRHGFFDGVDREFRGFGYVEERDSDIPATEAPPAAPHVPTTLKKTWYHTGAYIEGGPIAQVYRSEYYAGDSDAQAQLHDTVLPPDLSAAEEHDACRALKGLLLREEVYALDGSPQQEHPYRVTATAYMLRRLQRRQGATPAVCQAYANEVLTFDYERNPQDPRVAHQLTLQADEFGAIRKSASIAYRRRGTPPFPEQERTWVTYTETDVIHRADETGWYRIGVPSEVRTYEIELTVAAGGRLTTDAFLKLLPTLTQIPFEAPPAPLTMRLVNHVRHLYLKDDLSGPLPLGQVESRALPYESYRLAFTLGLLGEVYEGRVTSEMLVGEGAYAPQDGSWWAPSGRQVFSPAHFYRAVEFVTPFGNTARVFYDTYALAVERTESSEVSALNSVFLVSNDYRTLAPARVTDANGNGAAVRFDELGQVIASAVSGKNNEGDTLDDPTTRIEYDLSRFKEQGLPNVVHTFAREQHGAANPRWQETYTYSDGFGRVIQSKIQAEPGLAPARASDGTLLLDGNGEPVMAHTSSRWVGNGASVFNNKGLPVRQYQPFFSSTPEYEGEADLVRTGVSSIAHYDPLGRAVRLDRPDGTFTRTHFHPWQRQTEDDNDTVLESSWYAARQALPPSDPERRAADLAAMHASTPGIAHLDALGRAFLAVANNGAAGSVATRIELDIHNRWRRIVDTLGRIVAQQTSDLLGISVRKELLDAGRRWTFQDVAGKVRRTWNSRGHHTRAAYDALQRPTELFVAENEGPERLVERTIYGESHPQATDFNLRARVYRRFDGAGEIVLDSYDFKGNLLKSRRRLVADHALEPDWAAAPSLKDEWFERESQFDALNRPIRLITPDKAETVATYNEANALQSLSVRLPNAAVFTPFVANIDYDTRGQRTRIAYGNGVQTEYEYDPLTFRLRRHLTRRLDNTVLQDLQYVYDPMGNIVEVRDGAQATVFFQNTVVSANAWYEYDALNRLVAADHREHVGLGGSIAQVDYDDAPRQALAHPHDGQAMRRYTEAYEYDAVGNLLRVSHHAIDDGSWTRRYDYAPPPGELTGNRLWRSSLPGDLENAFSATYAFDPHGNLTSTPHLSNLGWDHRDQLRRVDLGGGGRAYYAYDGSGQRVRKVVERPGALLQERIYLDGVEIYRERQGATAQRERQTLHVLDDRRRIALVETLTRDEGTPVLTPHPVLRYQMGNHLGTACLELDEGGSVISYEEYYPFGSTSFQSGPSAAETGLKRYRYTGKERDEETGFYYFGARYYASWLGRWTAVDPSGLSDGLNTYIYVNNNPIRTIDPDGRQSNPFSTEGKYAHEVTYRSLQEYQASEAGSTHWVHPDGRVTAIVYKNYPPATVAPSKPEPKAAPKPKPAPRPPPAKKEEAKPLDIETLRLLAYVTGPRYTYHPNVYRVGGFFQFLGGGLEGIGGVFVVLAPEPLLTKGAGGFMVLHGADTASSGLLTMWSGKPTPTLTYQLTFNTAKRYGADDRAAHAWGYSVDFLATVGPGLALEALPRTPMAAFPDAPMPSGAGALEGQDLYIYLPSRAKQLELEIANHLGLSGRARDRLTVAVSAPNLGDDTVHLIHVTTDDAYQALQSGQIRLEPWEIQGSPRYGNLHVEEMGALDGDLFGPSGGLTGTSRFACPDCGGKFHTGIFPGWTHVNPNPSFDYTLTPSGWYEHPLGPF
jgi:RHS repeat-associated protein